MKFTRRAGPTSEGISAANYLKIGDGQSVTGVPRGEIYEFYQKWPQGGMKETFDKPTQGASSRFKINLVIQEDGKFVAKVFEFGPRVYNQFADISDELDLEKTKIKISRRGAGKSTEWNVFPLGAVDAKALKLIAATELNELGVSGATPQASDLEVEAESDDDSVPF